MYLIVKDAQGNIKKPQSLVLFLYEYHGREFESWLFSQGVERSIHWISVHDCGWYADDVVQGMWIAWRELTGKKESAIKWIQENFPE